MFAHRSIANVWHYEVCLVRTRVNVLCKLMIHSAAKAVMRVLLAELFQCNCSYCYIPKSKWHCTCSVTVSYICSSAEIIIIMWVFVMSPECYCELRTWQVQRYNYRYTVRNDPELQSSCCTLTFSFICGCYVNNKKVIQREPGYQVDDISPLLCLRSKTAFWENVCLWVLKMSRWSGNK